MKKFSVIVVFAVVAASCGGGNRLPVPTNDSDCGPGNEPISVCSIVGSVDGYIRVKGIEFARPRCELQKQGASCFGPIKCGAEVSFAESQCVGRSDCPSALTIGPEALSSLGFLLDQETSSLRMRNGDDIRPEETYVFGFVELAGSPSEYAAAPGFLLSFDEGGAMSNTAIDCSTPSEFRGERTVDEVWTDLSSCSTGQNSARTDTNYIASCTNTTGPEPEHCSEQSDCADGLTCNHSFGWCLVECRSDGDCEAPLSCQAEEPGADSFCLR
jgi:hypothetical protein